MYRTRTCGELRIEHIGEQITIAGWVQSLRDFGKLSFLDVRDRYGITQVVFNSEENDNLYQQAHAIGREYVVAIIGVVRERENKNPNIPTGAVEVIAQELKILNESEIPPFTIIDDTDGSEELRLKYRYLDIRRNPVKDKLIFRHQVAQLFRKYLSDEGFVEVETPVLIKSTPEGARDFVVPSRVNPGQFYALPQSPQTFKQLLMVGGLDKYFQIVKCFRDEDLRADRQPEFTQVDCEMSFVEQEDIIQTFEHITRKIFKELKGLEIGTYPRMSYDEAMFTYGNDKPDIRFEMKFVEIQDLVKGKNFAVFEQAELVVGICVQGGADWSRKQIDEWIDYVKQPQIGATGLVWAKYSMDGSISSSVGKFYDETTISQWISKFGANQGDLMLIMAGDAAKVRPQLSALRMAIAEKMGLRKPNEFAPLWVVDFPLLDWDEESGRYHAMHHPFTSPKSEDIPLLETNPRAVRANAYDLVLNGNEIGGGSVRIHNRALQETMFSLLGFSPEQAEQQFGFLLNAFKYGAPPHAGIALGFDRLVSILGGSETIRDYIAFPKNNSARDIMIDAPSAIDKAQLDDLAIQLIPNP